MKSIDVIRQITLIFLFTSISLTCFGQRVVTAEEMGSLSRDVIYEHLDFINAQLLQHQGLVEDFTHEMEVSGILPLGSSLLLDAQFNAIATLISSDLMRSFQQYHDLPSLLNAYKGLLSKVSDPVKQKMSKAYHQYQQNPASDNVQDSIRSIASSIINEIRYRTNSQKE